MRGYRGTGGAGGDGDGLFSPKAVLTNVPPFNAPFPLSVRVPSSLCVFTLFTATSWMFYLLSWEN